jgi:formylmethanofuran dehydrogenase subunit C
MKGGTLFLLGGAELRTGAWMVRGTIVCSKAIPLLPTFAFACTYKPVFMNLYARRLQELGFSLPHRAGSGGYQRYSGDAAVPGKGEILVWQPQGVATSA